MVGSPMMMARGRGTSAAMRAASECAPTQPTSSSYDKAKWIGFLSGALTNSGSMASPMA